MSNRLIAASIVHESSPAFLSVPRLDAAGPMACPATMGPDGSLTIAGPWIEIYRLAYEQARAALTPSWFQRMTQPSWN
ncbi:hypothetical protein OJF2_11640 [Aquisphaera giovannonii]|uniref:Uncharacterized protein n=1 Tax=Aquisphaera giovannonii TaxID=406548 RepID=A0A5B9VY80_9BACT|nr:hypothetical protein [Aquisphaera giovannonii]QEH32685.1 hypothetical protein OJF2_11640 [Aquisphaera giovannonii]